MKISDLPEKTSPDSGAEMAIVQDGVTYRSTIAQIQGSGDAGSLRGTNLDAATVGAPVKADILVFDGTDWIASKNLDQTAIAALFSEGIRLRNTTTTTGGTPLQASPTLELVGHYYAGSDNTQTWLQQARLDSTGTYAAWTLYGDDGLGGGGIRALSAYRTSDTTTILEIAAPAASDGVAAVTFGDGGAYGNIGGSFTSGDPDVVLLGISSAGELGLTSVGNTQATSGGDFGVAASGSIVLSSGADLTADVPGSYELSINGTLAISIADLAGSSSVVFSGDYGPAVIAVDDPTTGVAGRDLGIFAGGGGTGNQNGGSLYVGSGADSGTGMTPGFVSVATGANEAMRLQDVGGTLAVLWGGDASTHFTQGFNITPQTPSSGAGRNIRLIGGQGAAGEDGGHAIVRAGDKGAGGTNEGTSRIETHDNYGAIVVGGDASSPEVTIAAFSPSAKTGASNTLALTDAGKLVTVSHGSATQLTVPANGSVAFPINTQLAVMQIGAGQVEIVEDAGVTVNVYAADTLFLAGQWAVGTLLKVGTDEWVLFGKLTPA